MRNINNFLSTLLSVINLVAVIPVGTIGFLIGSNLTHTGLRYSTGADLDINLGLGIAGAIIAVALINGYIATIIETRASVGRLAAAAAKSPDRKPATPAQAASTARVPSKTSATPKKMGRPKGSKNRATAAKTSQRRTARAATSTVATPKTSTSTAPKKMGRPKGSKNKTATASAPKKMGRPKGSKNKPKAR